MIFMSVMQQKKFKKFANSILPYDVDKTQAIDIEDY